LPSPGAMVHLSPPFQPPVLKGIKVHPDNPLQLDFIVDKGDGQLSDSRLKEESTRLIKYFLASLTVPEKDLWVNLSPYEKDRIIPQSFGLTEMGRDLLAEDYVLKQITASLIYPENETGKKFWKRIYEEAARKFGTTDIPVNTFNKVWIVPQKAVVYENAKAGTAYVVESRLKVMLDQDYLALERNSVIPQNDVNALGSKIVREIVIPQLTKEINEGGNFAPLRQVYNSLILAAWYKKKIKDSILAQVYEDKNKIAGAGINDPQEKEKIYRQYLQAFKKGVYNYIKEENDSMTRQAVPRKYFSGGASFYGLTGVMTFESQASAPMTPQKDLAMITVKLQQVLDLFRRRNFFQLTDHSVLLPGGAVLMTLVDQRKIPNPRFFVKNVESAGRGTLRVTNTGGYAYQTTPFWVINGALGVMKRIELLDQERADKNVPIVILDWGCGTGEALVGLLHRLQQRELEGRGIANVVLYGFSDEFYPEWKKVPQGITFIWGTADHLRYLMNDHLHGVSLIYSHQGLEHIFNDMGLFKRHFLDLYYLLDTKKGILLIADTPYRREFTPIDPASIREYEAILEGRYAISFLKDYDSPLRHSNILHPTEWKPVVRNDSAMSANVPARPLQAARSLDNAMAAKGGIDFTAGKAPLEIQNAGEGIKFRLDPVMLQELQNAAGFVPVIINIQPVTDLRLFLGLTVSK